MKRILPLILFYLTTLNTYSQVTQKDNSRRYLITETKTFASGTYGLTADVTIEKNDYVEIISEDGDNITFRNVTPTLYTEAVKEEKKKSQELKKAKDEKKTLAKDDVADKKILDAKSAQEEADAVLTKIRDYVNTNNDVKALPKALFYYYAKQQFLTYKGAGVGIYTVPFKLRPGENFDFEAALSLSTNIVFGFGKKDSAESFLDASIGIGVTSISLTKDNSTVTENRTATALTLSSGSVIKFTNNANIGLFFGGDFLNSNDSKTDWIHNKNLWIGIGINVTFSKIETNKQSKKSVEYDKKVKEEISLIP